MAYVLPEPSELLLVLSELLLLLLGRVCAHGLVPFLPAWASSAPGGPAAWLAALAAASAAGTPAAFAALAAAAGCWLLCVPAAGLPAATRCFFLAGPSGEAAASLLETLGALASGSTGLPLPRPLPCPLPLPGPLLAPLAATPAASGC